MKKNNTCTAQAKEKASRYAQTAPRTPIPRPTVFGSKKELSTNMNE